MPDRHKVKPLSLRLPEALLASVTKRATITGKPLRRTIVEAIEHEERAAELLKEALHLRMHGERAPGGNETWAEWDRNAETFLRGRLES